MNSLTIMERIDARIETGLHAILLGTACVIVASCLSIYRNWKR